MAKSYLLCKCGAEGRIPLVVFTADNVDEAREAPTWLRHKHPDTPELRLGPGEFFEILEKDLCPADEWEAALSRIKTPVT